MWYTVAMSYDGTQYDDGTNDPRTDPVLGIMDLAITIESLAEAAYVMAVLARDAGLPDAGDLHDLRHMLYGVASFVTGIHQAWARREDDGHTSWQHMMAGCQVAQSVALCEVYVDTIAGMA